MASIDAGLKRPPRGRVECLAVKDGQARQGLLVVIVNFRTPGVTIDCLKTLASEAASMPDLRVVVVENGSGDQSAALIGAAIIEHRWGSWAKLAVNAQNSGFAGGNNFGIEHEPGPWKYVLLLNSDTLVDSGCLRACVQTMDADETIGAMSCHVLNADRTVQNVSRLFPTPPRLMAEAWGLHCRMPALFGWADIDDGHWDRASTRRDVDWVGGAFMMLRAEWIAKHGGLDERFFFYGEDIEMCHRVWSTGYRVVFDPCATIVHLGGTSSDPTRMAARVRNVNVWRGRYMTLRLCYGRIAEWMVRGWDIFTQACHVVTAKAMGRKDQATHRSDVLALLVKPLWPRLSTSVESSKGAAGS